MLLPIPTDDQPCCSCLLTAAMNSLNCKFSLRSCEYITTLPLREKRRQGVIQLTGQYGPCLTQHVAIIPSYTFTFGTGMDPFDVLPLQMPFRSKELFQSFHQFGSPADVPPPCEQGEDCVALAALDRHALRNTLLLAGLHYAWMTGGLYNFNSAFLHHKVEAIRSINHRIESPNTRATTHCVRQIATICLTEACLGNFATVNAHLNGLVTFLQVADEQDPSRYRERNADTELADRYFLLIYIFVHMLKSRLADFISFGEGRRIGKTYEDLSVEDIADLMHSWHLAEIDGLESRLKAIRMFPHFFRPVSSVKHINLTIDATTVIDYLKKCTDAIDEEARGGRSMREHLWTGGTLTKLLLALVDTHVTSIAKRQRDFPPQSMRLTAGWSSIASAGGLYFHYVLDMANMGNRINHALLRRILLILRRDLERVGSSKCGDPALQFWMLFLGSLALAQSQDTSSSSAGAISQHTHMEESCTPDMEMEELQIWFKSSIGEWSHTADVQDWVDAKVVLQRITWPTILPIGQESIMENLWYSLTSDT
ncbi:hypothetical protein BX600DRAFT_100788 [Xylariales sp. PMI_506]|nr:hypothetical protein BX600DRAFT_100788 [Xylariales sp. PMI_506]